MVLIGFRRALQCKTPALGTRVYASPTEEREFPNTCKSPGCASCGHSAMIHWRRQRWCAFPEGPYCAITFTMPNTLWPIFAANPRLCKKLAEIAARVIVSYGRVHRGIELGVVPIVQTFNGKLDFNPHVHVLVTARNLQSCNLGKRSSFFFDGERMGRSWKRLVIVLLRLALVRGQSLARDDVQRILDLEENEFWMPAHVRRFSGKKHFLLYAARYVRRPPISRRRILRVEKGLVHFWYKDKRSRRTEVIVCTVEEFIDRWVQHIPQHYQHGVRYFGLFAPRNWGRIATAVFALSGEKPRLQPIRQPWAVAVEKQFGQNPLVDSKGQRMRFIRHLLSRA